MSFNPMNMHQKINKKSIYTSVTVFSGIQKFMAQAKNSCSTKKGSESQSVLIDDVTKAIKRKKG